MQLCISLQQNQNASLTSNTRSQDRVNAERSIILLFELSHSFEKHICYRSWIFLQYCSACERNSVHGETGKRNHLLHPNTTHFRGGGLRPDMGIIDSVSCCVEITACPTAWRIFTAQIWWWGVSERTKETTSCSSYRQQSPAANFWKSEGEKEMGGMKGIKGRHNVWNEITRHLARALEAVHRWKC